MRKLMLILSILMVASMLLTACGGGATPAAAETEAPSSEGLVEIRWFIGLGAGGNPEEVEK